jgi:predicted small lipoprotein YifL
MIAGPMRKMATILMVIVLGAALSGCGKKADPDPPPGKKSEYPRAYPR